MDINNTTGRHRVLLARREVRLPQRPRGKDDGSAVRRCGQHATSVTPAPGKSPGDTSRDGDLAANRTRSLRCVKFTAKTADSDKSHIRTEGAPCTTLRCSS